MYLLILVLPLVNFLIACLFGKLVGNLTKFFFVVNMFVLTLISFFLFYEAGINKYVCYLDLGTWFHLGLLRLN
jgi:hypothetical protein